MVVPDDQGCPDDIALIVQRLDLHPAVSGYLEDDQFTDVVFQRTVVPDGLLVFDRAREVCTRASMDVRVEILVVPGVENPIGKKFLVSFTDGAAVTVLILDAEDAWSPHAALVTSDDPELVAGSLVLDIRDIGSKDELVELRPILPDNRANQNVPVSRFIRAAAAWRLDMDLDGAAVSATTSTASDGLAAEEDRRHGDRGDQEPLGGQAMSELDHDGTPYVFKAGRNTLNVEFTGGLSKPLIQERWPGVQLMWDIGVRTFGRGCDGFSSTTRATRTEPTLQPVPGRQAWLEQGFFLVPEMTRGANQWTSQSRKPVPTATRAVGRA